MAPAPQFSPEQQQEMILDAAVQCIQESSITDCCGQLIPDSKLSFSSKIAGAIIPFLLCGRCQL